MSLRDLCEVTIGRQRSPKHATGTHMVRYLRSANVKDGRLDLSDVLEMNFTPSEQRTYALQSGDVLVTEGCGSPRELGASAQWRGYSHNVVCFQNTLLRLRSRPGSSDGGYLAHLARWCQRTGLWLEASSGVSILHIGHNRAERIQVPQPPLPTQCKIGAILLAYDDLIENNTRRIKILEEMAQRIYREWFVEFRYRGHAGVRMVDSELGPIPDGWEVERLSEVVTTQYGYTESTSTEPIGPKFLRGMDMNKASFIDWSCVPYCPITESDHAKYRLARGDVLVIRMADPGKVGIIERDVDAVFASYLIRLRPRDDKITPLFLFFYLSCDAYQSYVTGASTGTTRKSLSAPVMTAIDLVVPPNEMQSQFKTQVAPVRDHLTSLLEANVNLRATRDLLLPRLISGEIDVENLDIDTSGLAA
ncbi:MAG: restriction endonuclease subunit S [Chloroflexota bacterium]